MVKGAPAHVVRRDAFLQEVTARCKVGGGRVGQSVGLAAPAVGWVWGLAGHGARWSESKRGMTERQARQHESAGSGHCPGNHFDG